MTVCLISTPRLALLIFRLLLDSERFLKLAKKGIHKTDSHLLTHCHVIVFVFQKEEFADLGAKQYYVEYQTDITSDRLMKLIPTYIPDSYLETTKAMEMWFQLIVHNLQKVILESVFDKYSEVTKTLSSNQYLPF